MGGRAPVLRGVAPDATLYVATALAVLAFVLWAVLRDGPED